MLERRYRRTQKSDDRLAGVEHELKRHSVYRQKESTFWSMRLLEKTNQPGKHWRSVATMMGSKISMKPSSTCPSAQQLLDFFDEKVATVRRAMNGMTSSKMSFRTLVGSRSSEHDFDGAFMIVICMSVIEHVANSSNTAAVDSRL